VTQPTTREALKYINAPPAAYRRPDAYHDGLNDTPLTSAGSLPYQDYKFLGRYPFARFADKNAATRQAKLDYADGKGGEIVAFATAKYWVVGLVL
jgi:hypothetical protein